MRSCIFAFQPVNTRSEPEQRRERKILWVWSILQLKSPIRNTHLFKCVYQTKAKWCGGINGVGDDGGRFQTPLHFVCCRLSSAIFFSLLFIFFRPVSGYSCYFCWCYTLFSTQLLLCWLLWMNRYHLMCYHFVVSMIRPHSRERTRAQTLSLYVSISLFVCLFVYYVFVFVYVSIHDILSLCICLLCLCRFVHPLKRNLFPTVLASTRTPLTCHFSFSYIFYYLLYLQLCWAPININIKLASIHNSAIHFFPAHL